MQKNNLKEELNLCLKIWEEKGECAFGGRTKCQECAVPYILLKLITKEVLHGDMKRLTLDDWKKKLNYLDSN